MPNDTTQPVLSGNETPAPKPEQEKTKLPGRKRALKVNKQEVVEYVLKSKLDVENERSTFIQKRLERYGKFRGWLMEKTDPIGNLSHNLWIPIMIVSYLRLTATLENALKGTRPLMEAKARQRIHAPKTERLDKYLDYQFFTELEGEKIIDDYVANLVQDGTVFTHQRYVKTKRTIDDVRVLPPLNPDIDTRSQLLAYVPAIFPTFNITSDKATMLDNEGLEWKVAYKNDKGEPSTAIVEFYEMANGRIQAHIRFSTTVYDGNVIEVHDLEDVLFPIRSANLQPPGPENPHGARFVLRLCNRVTVDEIVRKVKDGTYSMISEEMLAAIENSRTTTGSGKDEDILKQEKDVHEGTQAVYSYTGIDTQIIEYYGPWDVDGDGLDEEVIFWVASDAKLLLEARLLTEVYPGLPIRRPFTSESLFPIPNRILGIGLLELLEPIQDAMKYLMDMNFDWGTITNLPFGFYRPPSSMVWENSKLLPGTLYPLDNPSQDVYFPTWNRDQSWNFNTYSLLQQLGERISMQSDFNYGRVPAGKASALRTVGTTMALLNQSDVRSEQVLRRVFHGFSQIYSLMHRLNRYNLVDKKEFRVAGFPGQAQDAYETLGPEEIYYDVDFEFRSSLLNSNKQAVAQAFSELAATLISPLAIQMGIVTQTEVHNLLRDMIKVRDFDPDRYSRRPPESQMGPKLLAEEAISLIISNQMPSGTTLEPPQEHLQKLMEFRKKLEEVISPIQLRLLEAWIRKVIEMARQEIMMQQMTMAAGQTQGATGASGPSGIMAAGQTSVPQTTQVGSGELIDESLGGLTQ